MSQDVIRGLYQGVRKSGKTAVDKDTGMSTWIWEGSHVEEITTQEPGALQGYLIVSGSYFEGQDPRSACGVE
jgi:hypothetical protein